MNVQAPVQLGWLRSIGHGLTAFMLESFIDRIAHASGLDPYPLRRSLLAAEPRALRVLDTAARAAGRGRPLPKGRALGLAYHTNVDRAGI